MINSKKMLITILITIAAGVSEAQTHKPDSLNNGALLPVIDKAKQEKIIAIRNSTRAELQKLLSDTTISPEKKRILQRKLMQDRTAMIDSIIGYKRKIPTRLEGPAVWNNAAQKQ